MTLNLHDTATRQTAPLGPVQPGAVSLYVCGPTTQGAPHLGHLRTFLAFDVLVRWLERSGYEVTHVRNVTDIDDKILVKSAEAGAPWWAWSLRFEREFQDTLDRIGNRRPTYEPRATGHVTEMIALMERLIERGHAYPDGAGSVYFDVASHEGYGSLTRQSLEDMQDAGEEAEPGKRDRRDFALWKAAKPTEPETASWDTPFGRGRPGWHLECSAMSRKYLGETFDIHAGGLDLRFPHHENEQAQSHAAGYGFARRWMHSGVLTVDGLKMGKSLDNFVTAARALADHPTPAVRLALVSGHYRATVEYNATAMREAETVWERLRATAVRAAERVGADPLAATEAPLAEVELPADFVAAMDDDLAVPEALAVLHREQAALNTLLGARDEAGTHAIAASLGRLRAMLDVLGLDPLGAQWRGEGGTATAEHAALDALISAQLAAREAARAEKDWARADALRDALTAAGIRIEDGRAGARWTLENRD
ncbi:cysteine--tRNA ligase [Brachybacterium saurashtrense]|uniref:Cysteine--tRNA ligase n=1 Tax=Brachybacterium saurashtrense TaxID=556288 RepID=A0A345YLK3_9MICO|nr:cysteine--tRNA ligase [Brachybacterium saurashtrense]AXK44805.1 cysteine--tRNA ligase [Brachybacterium saurashtrense]RRR23417.1 cysteine--tRNA ligase [Brachybacterium saurashtrense]